MTASRKMSFGRYDYAAFLTFFTYASGSVVVPVALVMLARDLGFSLESGGMTAGGALHLGRTVAMVGTMLLSGFAAGHWGMRQSLGVAVLLMGLGMLLCAFAPIYGVLLLALLLAGCGEGVIEGLVTPFVQDLHQGDEPGRYINFSHAFWSVGVLVTVLVSGALLTLGVSWRLLVGCVSFLGFLSGALLLGRSRSGPRYPDATERTHWSHIWGFAAKLAREPRFWLYYAAMFLAGGGEFCLTFWSASHIQLRYGTQAWSGGVGVALFAAGMVLGRIGWGYLIRQHQLKQLLVCSAVVGTGVCLFLPTADTVGLFFGLLFLAGVATAPFWPSIQSYATDRLPGADSTVLLILLSCAGVPGCGVFTYLMGALGNRSGDLTTAFYLVPACYGILGILVAIDWLLLTPRPNNSGRAVKPTSHNLA
ncbi:MAG: MFS transporter [Verrucomicrobia bacterium]|nr:MFS transporter [Verrucomicrobiota bacterium]MBT7065057.1 MFS transporter [Verrucomicrobiota bacterium]MBT7699584.1 MFS transporter [Verrucomicrobiota bacterium]